MELPFRLPQVGEIWQNVYLQNIGRETTSYPAVILSEPELADNNQYYFEGFCLTRERRLQYIISNNNYLNWKRLV